MKLKKDNELLFIIGNAAFWMAIGAGLIYSDDNGGIAYIGFGVLLLLMELVSEKWACERLKRELSRERKQHNNIIVKVGE
jgi:hypothetical protein